MLNISAVSQNNYNYSANKNFSDCSFGAIRVARGEKGKKVVSQITARFGRYNCYSLAETLKSLGNEIEIFKKNVTKEIPIRQKGTSNIYISWKEYEELRKAVNINRLYSNKSNNKFNIADLNRQVQAIINGAKKTNSTDVSRILQKTDMSDKRSLRTAFNRIGLKGDPFFIQHAVKLDTAA